MSKVRIVWNTSTLSVHAVVPDDGQSRTILPENDPNIEFAVTANITAMREGLLAQGYNVQVIDEYLQGLNNVS